LSSPAVAARPRRILHVVPSLERGGIELWLLAMVRAVDPARYAMDFLVLHQEAGALGAELRSRGCHVLVSPAHRNPRRVMRDFAVQLQRHGPYDVVHGHVHHYNGLVMRLAAWHRIPCRIAHSHNDTRIVERQASWRRRCYLALMRRWIGRFATRRIAVSRSAAEDLFGDDWLHDRRCQVISCGFDLASFAHAGDRRETRQALGLPDDALVIGHVGRFHERKNHRLLLEIAVEVAARAPAAHLLLVGEGELRPAIAARAEELQIADRTVFTGARSDIPRLMQAMDVFVFPSYHEGLGLAVLEAQASGLPCILAADLPEEVDVVPGLVSRVPRTVSAASWAEAVLAASGASHRPTAGEAWQMISRSPFSMEHSVAQLLEVYDGEARGGMEPGRLRSTDGGRRPVASNSPPAV
jgi:glycosyltransferase involved in cell wall biosynthesis